MDSSYRAASGGRGDAPFQARAESPAGLDLPLPESPSLRAVDSGARRGEGFTSTVARGKVMRGTAFPKVDPRKWKYNRLRGESAALVFEVSRDDRMSAEEAGVTLHALHVMFGIDRESEELLTAFDNALWFCHTVNGSSVLNPGRSAFTVPGSTVKFSYEEVRNKLGVDLRRFFRAFADDIAQVNLKVLADYDPDDPVKTEQWAWLQEVALKRNLLRYPHLAHDSADACLLIGPVERAALSASKCEVMGTTVNSADRLSGNSRVMSADRYDSTTRTSL